MRAEVGRSGADEQRASAVDAEAADLGERQVERAAAPVGRRSGTAGHGRRPADRPDRAVGRRTRTTAMPNSQSGSANSASIGVTRSSRPSTRAEEVASSRRARRRSAGRRPATSAGGRPVGRAARRRAPPSAGRPAASDRRCQDRCRPRACSGGSSGARRAAARRARDAASDRSRCPATRTVTAPSRGVERDGDDLASPGRPRVGLWSSRTARSRSRAAIERQVGVAPGSPSGVSGRARRRPPDAVEPARRPSWRRRPGRRDPRRTRRRRTRGRGCGR